MTTLTPINAKVIVGLLLDMVGSNDAAMAHDTVKISNTTEFTAGTEDQQIQLAFASNQTLADGATNSLVLANHNLRDPNNDLLNFANVLLIYIRANPDNTSAIIIGNSGSQGFVGPFGAATHDLHLQPGCEFLIYHNGTGWPVVGGTSDTFKITDGGSAGGAFEIVILGS